MKLIIFLPVFFILSACVQKPTKVFTSDEVRNKIYAPLVEGAQKPLEIKEDTIIIDARPTFSYSTAHIPGSINIQWTEFSNHRSKNKGRLRKDHRAMVKRLARIGIGPKTPVIIVDKGLYGHGEAGRLAWTFYYLGVKNVQIASYKALKSKLTLSESKNKQPHNFWRPQIQNQILISKKEFSNRNEDLVDQKKSIILDVRTEKEFASANNNSSIHIDWHEFFNSKGRPKLSFKKRLKLIGVNKDKEVIVVSNKGVRSAAVTMALLSMGFENVKNFNDGF